jgi:hypothetical protein
MGPGLVTGLDNFTGIAATDQTGNKKSAGQTGGARRGIQQLI